MKLFKALDKFTAGMYLKSWRGDYTWPDDNRVMVLKRYEESPVAVDLYWTIKDARKELTGRHISPLQLYRRCDYSVCKGFVEMTEKDALHQMVADMLAEMDKENRK